MRRATILGALCFLHGAACYESTPFGEDAPDALGSSDGSDGAADEAAEDDGAADEAVPFCGDEKEPRPTLSRVVNGTPSFDPAVVALSDGEVLAVGALLEQDRWSGQWSGTCTATLIAPRTVLTAAHCVTTWRGTIPASRLRFAVGRDSAAPTAVLNVAEVHAHPSYRGGWGADQARYDQAVLVLGEDASVSAPGIVPIRPNRVPLTTDFIGTVVQNVGYGATDPRGGANTLRWWTVEEVTALTDYDFTVYGGGVSSVCFGDSGGPSLRMSPGGFAEVVGTVSWGDPSCVDYDHFARTDYNMDFLDPYLVDPCGGVDWYGGCEGPDAVWCEDGEIRRRDCAACSQVCGDAGPSWGYYCI